MKFNATSKLLIAAICSLASASAFGFTYIVEGGPGGQNTANYTDSGFAASSGTDTAPGCTATGTRVQRHHHILRTDPIRAGHLHTRRSRVL